MSDDLIVLIAIVYVAAMFAAAAWVQRRRERRGALRFRLPAYTLALAVYCTSWTYFGAVGTAVTDGWGYLPIYFGPILLFALAPAFLQRLVAAVRADGATSISDFIGSRFGKSRGVAALVTILALFGTIPYLALQLRSVGISYALIAHQEQIGGAVVSAAILLAGFAIMFGVRHYEIAGRNEAVLYIVAGESVLKLVALIGVAVFAGFILLQAPAGFGRVGWEHLRAGFAPARLTIDFPVVTGVSILAFLCLPRQFYVGVMGAHAAEDIGRARWPFVLYLLLTVLAVLPIAAAGLAVLPPGSRPDFFVLSLPIEAGETALALIVFLGGLSAAVAMGVTEAIALSTMVSNDLIAPFLLRSRVGDEANVGRIMLWVRRAAILVLMTAAAAYALLIPSGAQLASVGLIAFVAIAQSAPALILAVSRTGNDSVAAMAGLGTGLLLWGYTLFLPSLGVLPQELAHGPFDPTALLGIGGLSPIVHGALWSLGGNLLALSLVSARRVRQDFAIDIGRPGKVAQVSTIGQLADMVARFTAVDDPVALFGPDRGAAIDRHAARTAERLIAGVVGVSSARAIMASALSGASIGVSDVALMLDASGQSLRFSQGLLAATLENIEPGVSVVDRNLRLIAWNSQYLDLFNYPAGMVRVGVPVADLIRFNAEQGECGPGEVEGHVARRLQHMREGHAHSFERRRLDGRILKTVGGPMPDGGYVMCFTDITAEARARAALERARAELEERVTARTIELSDANARLAGAIADKTRFLAAASHDLLQPLHAARLFAAALKREVPEAALAKLDRIDRSIESANDLLRALLDISKLDAGGIVPQPTRFRLRPMLAELVESFEPLAAERGLALHLGAVDAVVETDRTLLRSIIQNFLSNAVRYTERGGILVGVRRRGGEARIEVYDTGPGIPADKQSVIFREFERLDGNSETGIGLGLAIVERTALLLGARVDLRSAIGAGSRFAVTLPIGEGAVEHPRPARIESKRNHASKRILVLDDEAVICDGMVALLGSLGHAVVAVRTGAAALAQEGRFDAALIDFSLGEALDGIDVIDRLRARQPGLAAALVTADRSDAMARRAAERGIQVLDKPLALATLSDWLAVLVQRG
ncbi:PAS-domain containing protein [Sphingomonas sp. dw_22]|uniref:hybrid sensor histidine kinase/response regulator n=1 Tax=Sphingomonas sp. dw_22 TaxID=2721175 RepID=UPI001BD4C917